MKLLCVAAATLLLGLGGGASAATFVTLGGVQWETTNSGNLSLTTDVPDGNQPLNSPCLICGANQPQQLDGFGYNWYKNQGSDTDISAFSNGDIKTTLGDDIVGVGYTIGDGSLFQAYLDSGGIPGSTTFSIGVDVNDTGDAQTLESFWFLNLTQHTVLASFIGTTDGNVPSVNNGTGFPDYSLTGFDLSVGDIVLGDTIIFLARMSGLNDGPDSFFLQATPAAIPLPAGVWLFGSAIAGLGALKLRRRRRSQAA